MRHELHPLRCCAHVIIMRRRNCSKRCIDQHVGHPISVSTSDFGVFLDHFCAGFVGPGFRRFGMC